MNQFILINPQRKLLRGWQKGHLKNSLDFKRHVIQRIRLRFFQASHDSKFRNLSFQLLGENNLYHQVNDPHQNSQLHFNFQLAQRERLRQNGGKSWIGILIGLKGRQRFPDSYDHRNVLKSTFVRRQIYGNEKKNH